MYAPTLLHHPKKLSLQEAVTSIHPKPPPNTYDSGQFPIDGIFLPEQWLLVVTGGYLAFNQSVPSDHRAVWVKIPIEIFG